MEKVGLQGTLLFAQDECGWGIDCDLLAIKHVGLIEHAGDNREISRCIYVDIGHCGFA